MSAGRPAIALPAYARALGMVHTGWEDAAPILSLDFSHDVSGHAHLFHGGALGGLLEIAALSALQAHFAGEPAPPAFKPINISVEYLRGAGKERTHALGQVVRAGRRLANLRVEAWQGEARDRIVALAFLNVLLKS